MRAVVLGFLFLLASPVLAQDPAPTPVQDLIAVVAPDAEVTGVGTRKDPFVFTAGTLCMFELTGNATKIEWNLDDAPAKTKIHGSVVVFPLVPGDEFIIAARWEGGASRNYWFEIKGANGPPQPINALAAKLKAALTGPDAKADAVQFTAIVRGVADQIEVNPPKVHKSLKALFATTLTATGWPAGKYPQLPDLWRSILPNVDETKEITSAELTEIVAAMRLLQKTGEAIANGK